MKTSTHTIITELFRQLSVFCDNGVFEGSILPDKHPLAIDETIQIKPNCNRFYNLEMKVIQKIAEKHKKEYWVKSEGKELIIELF